MRKEVKWLLREWSRGVSWSGRSMPCFLSRTDKTFGNWVAAG